VAEAVEVTAVVVLFGPLSAVAAVEMAGSK
jgi:hypothetical protein